MKILIVEDEQDMLNSITAYLAREGYVCEIATTFIEADEKLYLNEYDCLILDITLPGGNGLDLLEKLKAKKNHTGAIIISAKNSIDDKIKGLNLGADDYLPKPFHLSELNARVNALLRRLKFEGSNNIEVGNLKIDLDQRIACVEKKALILNRKEYELLLFFVSNKNRVVKKTSLTEHLWGDSIYQVDSYDFLYSQIKNLRKKLTEGGCKADIQTVYGIGYKFISE
jgi:DNA-binding response OmpR family regulator